MHIAAHIPPSIPMIYTVDGNLPIDSLELRTSREDEKDQIVFIETYHRKDDGREVRRSAHVLPLAEWQTGEGGRMSKYRLSMQVGNVGGGPIDATAQQPARPSFWKRIFSTNRGR